MPRPNLTPKVYLATPSFKRQPFQFHTQTDGLSSRIPNIMFSFAKLTALALLGLRYALVYQVKNLHQLTGIDI